MSRSLLILLAILAATVNVQAAGKGHKSASHHARKAPRHVSHSKVTHHRRPAVHRRPAQHVRHRTTRIVRQPVKRTVVRTVHRYPLHRARHHSVRRPYYHGHHSRHHRYTYFYYPGRYRWQTNHYNRGYGVSHRRAVRGIRGIVESVQGNAGNGTLLVKVMRPRSSRFRYATTNAAAGRGATSLRRFHVNSATRYEIMTGTSASGTFANLHKGERVLVLTQGNSAQTARKIEVFARRKR
jgi:hypothetical protein